jgi:hypothetical protein
MFRFWSAVPKPSMLWTIATPGRSSTRSRSVTIPSVNWWTIRSFWGRFFSRRMRAT